MLNAMLGPQRIRVTLWVTVVVAVVGGLAMYALSGSLLFSLFLGMFAWQAFQALRENRGS